jgi:hypothetical protein
MRSVKRTTLLATQCHNQFMQKLVLMAAATLTSVLISCSNRNEPVVLIVPSNYNTIQAAVDAARSGDIIEIEPGIYNEEVLVTKDSIVIRGKDRNRVILDGSHRLANGIYVAANDVRVESLTVHSYTQNGILFSGADTAGADIAADKVGTPGNSLVGFEVGWVTSYNNGLYGIYGFAASDGIIEHSLVSGHPDSGVYIGQCNPCRTVIRDVIAEFNAIGYYGTNASGDLFVINSIFRNNRLGVAPNSQRTEGLFPQQESTIVGNLVLDNDEARAPVIAEGFFGGGIVIGGGAKNVVLRNRVEGHSHIGIGVINFNGFAAMNNRVAGNKLADNEVDLVFIAAESGGISGNCFSGNFYTTSLPPDIDRVLPCDATPRVVQSVSLRAAVSPPDVDYRRIPPPNAQPVMPPDGHLRPAGVRPFVPPPIDTIVLP